MSFNGPAGSMTGNGKIHGRLHGGKSRWPGKKQSINLFEDSI